MARQGSRTRVAERTLTLPDGANTGFGGAGAGGRVRAAVPATPVRWASGETARPTMDLGPGKPDLSGFPRTAWLTAGRRALISASNDLLGYPDPRGHLGLREVLAGYLGRVRGVRTVPDRIVICSGFVQALSLLATALRLRDGSTMSVEGYGLAFHREVIRAAGLTTLPLAVDEFGARTADLAGCAAALLTPAHQFPLGVPLSADRRSLALEWAARSGGLLIEDDYDGEFRYDRKPIGALQGLAPDLVAYIGTASKSLAPALGLAWLVVPGWLLADVVSVKRHTDSFTGVFEQLTLAEFIQSGAYDRHLRRSRLGYQRRRDYLVSALARRVPSVRVTGIAAGLHALLELPGQRVDAEPAICTRAARAGLTLDGLAGYRYHPDSAAPAALVIGYASPPEHAYANAIDALCTILP